MIPYNTDAPLYHSPIATVALIVLNCLLFFAVPGAMLQPSDPDPAEFQWGEDDPAGAPEDPAVIDDAEDWAPGDFQIMDDQPLEEPADETVDEAAAETQAPLAASDRQAGWEISDLTLALEYGVGLKPWQWLTSIFMHADFFHLLFNMIALWAFGLVVEGKVGSLVFTALYLAIGVVQNSLEQTLMLFAAGGGSLGASAAIFGILGIAVVWAPRNEFDVFWFFGLRTGSIEVPIVMYALLVLTIEGISIAVNGFSMSSGVLHLMGLVLGLAVGYVWLRRRWVDCEGWDLINVWQGNEVGNQADQQQDDQARQLVRASTRRRHSSTTVAERDRSSRPAPAPAPAPPAQQPSDRPLSGRPLSGRRRPKPPAAPKKTYTDAMKDVELLIADGNIATALKLLAKLKVSEPTLQLAQTAVHRLIKELLAAKNFTAAVPFMREYTARFTEHRVPMQLNLAKLLLHLQQPRKAADVLRAMRSQTLESSAQAAWQELAAHAQHQISEGVVEVSEEG